MNVFERLKYEFSLLGDTIKLVLRVLFYVIVLYIIYTICLPFVKYYLPKDMTEEEYENISGFIIIGLVWLSIIINKIIESLFKNDTKE